MIKIVKKAVLTPSKTRSVASFPYFCSYKLRGFKIFVQVNWKMQRLKILGLYTLDSIIGLQQIQNISALSFYIGNL